MDLIPALASTKTLIPGMQFPGLEKVVTQIEVIPLTASALVTLVMLGCIFRWLGRGALLRRARKADAEFMQRFRASAHALALYQETQKVEGSPRSALYMNACRELAFHLLGTDTVDKNFSIKLRAAGRVAPTQWQAVLRASRRSIGESSRWLRAGLHGAGVRWLLPLGILGMALALLERVGTASLDLEAVGSAARPLLLAFFFHMIGMAWHRRLERRVDEALAKIEDFDAELGALLDRSYVDHRQPMEPLPSIGGMGIADGPTFSLPPSESSWQVTR